uniref:SWIM-type domain-containing protein n=1 Tax=Lactuca sativa TaxID=4236 RepID=A0A9R1W078_LACSA|nr:hypothetical protein LSAT_V11C400171740 [Lactuca sativa]
MMTFEGVMQCQRYNQIINHYNTATTFPRFITSHMISDSENTCFQMSVTSCNGVDTIIVLEKQKNISTRQPTSLVVDDKLEEYHYDCLIKDIEYTVTQSTTDGPFKCSCMQFEHVRLLCRHIFCVFKFYSIEKIPKQYILRC